jgi:hypothetical protein
MNPSKFKRGLAAIAVVGLAASVVTGCGSKSKAYDNSTVSYANDICMAQTDAVDVYPTSNGTGIHVETVHGVNWVAGYVWASCPIPPISHILDVELWFHSFGSTTWEPKPSRAFVYKNIPPMDSTFSYGATYTCVPGLWQVRWSVVGKDNLGDIYTYSHEWQVATITALDCDKPVPSVAGTTAGGPVVP